MFSAVAVDTKHFQVTKILSERIDFHFILATRVQGAREIDTKKHFQHPATLLDQTVWTADDRADRSKSQRKEETANQNKTRKMFLRCCHEICEVTYEWQAEKKPKNIHKHGWGMSCLGNHSIRVHALVNSISLPQSLGMFGGT